MAVLTTLTGAETVDLATGDRVNVQTIADLAGSGGAGIVTVVITTGAVQVDFDLADYGDTWLTLNIEITSGGTAGTEVMHFVGPEGDLANTTVGRTINVLFAHQTDPSDVINITQNDDATFSCIDNVGTTIGTFSTAVLDEEGNNICFSFTGDVILDYRWNCLFGAWDNPTEIADKRYPLPKGGNFGDLPYAQGDGTASWGSAPAAPNRVFNAGSVNNLVTNYPAGSNPGGMAAVFDALTPVVGSVVAGGGARHCIVISDSESDYLVMFIFP